MGPVARAQLLATPGNGIPPLVAGLGKTGGVMRRRRRRPAGLVSIG